MGVRRPVSPQFLPCRRRLRTNDRAVTPYSIGSSLTMDAAWLFPTQNVAGVVELSMKTRRIFVKRGSRYSTISPVFGLRRSTRSLNSPPDQTSPFLSAVASYGHDSGVGAIHS